MRLDDDRKILLPPPGPRVHLHSKVTNFERRRKDMETERAEFLEEWRDISDYIQLRRGRFLLDENRKNRRRRGNKLLNEKALFASRTCGAGMLAGVSSPSRPWLKVGTGDKALNENANAKRWIDQVERLIYDVFSASNYYHVKQQSYRDMGDFGQGPVIIDEDFDNVINCYCSPPGEYYLSVNHVGVVDTCYRDMRLSTLTMMEKFHRFGGVPKEVRAAYDRGDYDNMWDVVSAIEPNFRHIKDERGINGMPFIDVYYCLKVEDKDGNAICRTTGSHENKISAPRWDVQPGDIYGDGPGSLILPTSKSLQVLERRKGQMVDKMAAPPTQSPSGKGEHNPVNHAPGGNTYYNPTQNAAGRAISPLYEVQGQQLAAVRDEGATLEQRIDIGYFVPLFMATLESNRRQVTAREIEERHEEKLIALGPVLERTHYEGLNNDITRVYGILNRHRVLPPPPPEIADRLKEVQVEYISLLATAQRAIGAGPIERLVGFVGNMGAVWPSSYDKINPDKVIDEYADVVGAPAVIVYSDEEVKAARQQKQQQEQAMQSMAVAAQGAETAKVLSEADTSRDSNLLADILGTTPQRLA
jgi:hypothetical protein